MNKKGFTLAELLAVIVIIAILSTIGYTSVSNSIEKSKEKSFEITKKSIKEAAIQLYKDVEDGTEIETDIQNDYLKITKDNLSGWCKSRITNGRFFVETLIDNGYLIAEKNKEIIDPKTGLSINDCNITVEKNSCNDKTVYSVSYYNHVGTNNEQSKACENALND